MNRIVKYSVALLKKKRLFKQLEKVSTSNTPRTSKSQIIVTETF